MTQEIDRSMLLEDLFLDYVFGAEGVPIPFQGSMVQVRLEKGMLRSFLVHSLCPFLRFNFIVRGEDGYVYKVCFDPVSHAFMRVDQLMRSADEFDFQRWRSP
ncbi:MAG: hypothetical protein O3B64_02900 [bacterium]|nr:hypothetical protein [bacterium]MDA1024388.1 hypothetical protein [bacterium]